MQSLGPVRPPERPHLGIEDILDWFASYAHLPRLRDEATLDGPLQRLVENLSDLYAYASGVDEELGAYEGVMDGRALMPGHFKCGLLERREAIPAAKSHAEPSRPGDEESSASIPTTPKPEDGGEALAPDPRPTRFFASLETKPERAGLEVACTMDGLLVELTRVPGRNLRLHLEMEGAAGDGGYSEDVVNAVNANARDLRLDETCLGIEKKYHPRRSTSRGNRLRYPCDIFVLWYLHRMPATRSSSGHTTGLYRALASLQPPGSAHNPVGAGRSVNSHIRPIDLG